MYTKIAFTLVLLFSAINVNAECTANGCNADQADPIKRIYLAADGVIYVEAPLGKENLDCTLAEGRYMALKSSHLLFNEIYSTLLSAVIANKKLFVRIKNGSANCEIAYVQLYP